MANPQAKSPVVAPTRERLTWQEICSRYPNEWVELTDWEDENEEDESDVIVSAVGVDRLARWR